jgi:outer membrane protein OmpA-like peptidoglycan-associated protein
MRKVGHLWILFVIGTALLFAAFGCCAFPAPPVVKNEVVSFENIYFDLDKAVIDESGKVLLQKYAPLFKAMDGKNIVVEGYCDERGSTKHNLVLSQKRADAVANYLVELGVPQEKLTAVGSSVDKSMVAGSSAEAWAKSRRAQFTIK